ncbi:glycoside hydrolase family 19 protein [Glaciecola siphonariae]|uniref:Glycoside hydrolase family 19 protein n=1 Tax=Glaciecola siphonariae TaxID=521012 RepID=A0ABV9LVW1_9ALTE
MKHFTRIGLLIALTSSLIGFTQAQVFQAEDYSAYNDTTVGNQGGAYRSDNVDIEASSEGGFNVGWIEASEWLVYPNLAIPSSGEYAIKLRVASPSGGVASVDLNAGAINFGDFVIPATGGWQSWRTVERSVRIDAGNYNLGVFAQTNGWNLNYIEVARLGSSSPSIVTVYEHCDYAGWRASLGEGNFNLASLGPRGFVNDKASSIRVAPGYEAVLFLDDNFAGRTVTIRGDDACLANNGMNDLASSIIVRRVSNSGGQPQGLAAIMSEAQFNQMFPNRNSFYTYAGLIEAAKTYPSFGGAGDLGTRKREVAAAMANFHHETGGLFYKEEIARGEYCSGTATPCGVCQTGKRYYGRGPIQLSWNFNYCAAGQALGLNLWQNPDQVAQSATIAWQTALWFWMTQSGAGNVSAHDAMVQGRGFGETIRTINGALECNGGNPAQVQSRINEYRRMIAILGDSPGANLGC